MERKEANDNTPRQIIDDKNGGRGFKQIETAIYWTTYLTEHKVKEDHIINAVNIHQKNKIVQNSNIMKGTKINEKYYNEPDNLPAEKMPAKISQTIKLEIGKICRNNLHGNCKSTWINLALIKTCHSCGSGGNIR